jgi:hypothetical protein
MAPGGWVCLFVYCRTSNFSAIWRLSPLPVTGLQILAYARRSGPLSREGSLSCHTYCDTGPRFKRSHPKERHLCPTVGFEPPTHGSSDNCTRRANHCATHATPGVGWGHNRGNCFYMILYTKIFLKSSQKPLDQKNLNLHESFLL